MTFADYAERWAALILPVRARATQATMRTHLKVLRAAFGSAQLDAVTYDTLQAFVSSQVDRGLSPRSIKPMCSVFNRLMLQAQKDGLVKQVPEPVLPKIRKTKQSCLTAEQMQQVCGAARTPTEKVLYSILAETGLRIGEALGLRLMDINLINSTLTVAQSVYAGQVQEPKTDSALRTICISPALASTLRQFIGDRKGKFLFSHANHEVPLVQRTLLDRLHATMQSLGFDQTGFHAFRRGNATLLCSVLGAPEKVAAMRLGHAGMSTTFRVYAQDAPFSDREWAVKLGEALWEQFTS